MTDEVFRLKISLLDTKVWREVLVPADFTLAKLHTVIQLSMGWEDCHMHGFTQGRSELPEKSVLRQVFPRDGTAIFYTYDYGDSWRHSVKRVESLPAGELQAPCCSGGALACPPEDSGGIPGYYELQELLQRKDLDEEEQERLEWAAGWNPGAFHLESVQQALAKKFKPRAKARSAPGQAPGTFTPKQGQYLAFIFWSTRINRLPPAQADIQRFFGVTAPAVHQMIVSLEKSGLLTRIPGQARAIQVTLDESQLPRLEEPDSPMFLPGRTWVKVR